MRLINVNMEGTCNYVYMQDNYVDIIQILSSTFYEDGSVSMSKTIDWSSFAIVHFIYTFDHIYDFKEERQNHLSWGPLTQNMCSL